jgi:hypothetical protein
MVGLGALIAPPAKSQAYEQTAIISRAKEEAKTINSK